MSWLMEKETLQEKARKFDQSIRLTSKNGLFWRVVAWLLFIVSFGKFKRESFLENFATTIGHVQAYPASWPTASVERVMVHESRHTRQARVCGFGIHPAVGLPLMAVLYGLLPLPSLLALARLWFELDADKAYWRFALANGSLGPDDIRRRAESFATTVAGPAYFWSTWPSFARRLFAKEAEKVISEHLAA